MRSGFSNWGSWWPRGRIASSGKPPPFTASCTGRRVEIPEANLARLARTGAELPLEHAPPLCLGGFAAFALDPNRGDAAPLPRANRRPAVKHYRAGTADAGGLLFSRGN